MDAGKCPGYVPDYFSVWNRFARVPFQFPLLDTPEGMMPGRFWGYVRIDGYTSGIPFLEATNSQTGDFAVSIEAHC